MSKEWKHELAFLLATCWNIMQHGVMPTTPDNHTDNFRGWIEKIAASLRDDCFAKLTIGHYTGKNTSLKKLQVRRVVIREQDMFSFTWQGKTRDTVKNTGIDEGLRWIAEAFADGFRTGTLFATDADWTYERAASGRDWLRQAPATHRDMPPGTHDRQKQRVLPAAAPAGNSAGHWQKALGITGSDGAVLPSAQDKFRQINRYVELLAPLIRDDMLKVADMGAGKGYLTFALYEYMTAVRGLMPTVTGVEQRPDLVALCNRTATASGFGGLHFTQGTIESFDAVDVNILIALHACDTATDDAIAKGIKAAADLIVVAPCCHKQIRREMDTAANRTDFLLRHGIFLERQAEMVTDAIRALVLESYGYRVKVFEFIAGEHTPKNIMITALRDPDTRPGSRETAQKTIAEAKARFGIRTHYLERILGGSPRPCAGGE